jgi:hypothetical protein
MTTADALLAARPLDTYLRECLRDGDAVQVPSDVALAAGLTWELDDGADSWWLPEAPDDPQGEVDRQAADYDTACIESGWASVTLRLTDHGTGRSWTAEARS